MSITDEIHKLKEVVIKAPRLENTEDQFFGKMKKWLWLVLPFLFIISILKISKFNINNMAAYSKKNKNIVWYVLGAIVALVVVFRKKIVAMIDKDPAKEGIQWTN